MADKENPPGWQPGVECEHGYAAYAAADAAARNDLIAALKGAREMSDDLVKRLRRVSMDLGVPSTTTLDSKVVAEAADRIEELEAKLETAVEALTQIERAYYQEATNPSPETVRRMAARMNGIARDTQNALAELTGGKDE